MRATVKDVARRAGVSPKTVSNVVNGLVPVSPATRKRVELALQELEYVPNLSARGLRNGRSGLIALALPKLETAYSAEIAHHVVEFAHEAGWSVQIEETGMEPVREHELLVKARAHQIDGLLLNPVVLEASALERGVTLPPVVLIGEVEQEIADRVSVDSVAAARDMTRFLLERGYREIVSVGGGERSVSAAGHLRGIGYREAMAEAGLPAREIEEADWAPAAAARAVSGYLDSHPLPDAFFCFTDGMAMGALSVITARGYRVPHDVALAGFDDIDAAQFLGPGLTTVSFDKREFAGRAFTMLVERMHDRDLAPRLAMVGHRIVERGSTRATVPA